MSASRSRSDVAAVREALSTLGLHGATDAASLKAAFRAAVKAARPDQAGGDAERFRTGHRRLSPDPGRTDRPAPVLAPPCEPLAPTPVLTLTPLQALAGARVDLRLGERTVRVAVPAGLRTGEHLRLRGGAVDGGHLYLAVLIRPQDGLSVMGDDLFMSWPTSARLLEDGGRVEIETHAGTRSAWITPNRRRRCGCD
jgi:curved DNA-binding protein